MSETKRRRPKYGVVYSGKRCTPACRVADSRAHRALQEALTGKAHEARESAEQAGADAKEYMHEKSDQAGTRMGEAKDAAGAKYDEAKDYVQEKSDEAGRKMRDS